MNKTWCQGCLSYVEETTLGHACRVSQTTTTTEPFELKRRDKCGLCGRSLSQYEVLKASHKELREAAQDVFRLCERKTKEFDRLKKALEAVEHE